MIMSKVVKWAATSEGEAECRAYATWTDTHWPGYDPQDAANTMFAYVRNDKYGQWVAPYLGPDFKWFGVDFPEPTSANPADDGATQRGSGVIATDPEWPEE
jgi:hypothetical protein